MNTQLISYISKSQMELAIGIAKDDAILDEAERLLVKGCNDDDDLQEFANTIAVLDKRSKAVTKARTNFVEPFKKDIRLVEIQFNAHKTELDGSLGKLNRIFIDYQMKVKERLEREAEARREQERKVEAERIARQAEAEAQVAAEMALFDEDVDEEVFTEPSPSEPVPAEVLPPVKPLNIATPKIKTESGATVKIKQEVIPIIRNKNIVPEIYKDVNLRRLIEAYEKGTHDVPGIEFILKNKPVVR